MAFLGHKSRREREWEEVREQAQADLVALGEDIRDLDLDIELPDVVPEAKTRYGQALDAYERASTVFDRSRRPSDLEAMTSALAEGRYAMTASRALLQGRPVPERRLPCFFDPRHGPSTEEVDWEPSGGQSRPVPACAADALRIREGFDPHGRQVLVDGRPTDYWNAPAHYAPWAGGYFGGAGGGLLGGLLVGSMLGGAMGLGGGLFDDIFGGDDCSDGGGFDGGGDFGGGDF